MIALFTASILSLTLIGTVRLAEQDITRKVTLEHRLWYMEFGDLIIKAIALFAGDAIRSAGFRPACQTGDYIR
jgi:hypothetical protein